MLAGRFCFCAKIRRKIGCRGSKAGAGAGGLCDLHLYSDIGSRIWRSYFDIDLRILKSGIDIDLRGGNLETDIGLRFFFDFCP